MLPDETELWGKHHLQQSPSQPFYILFMIFKEQIIHENSLITDFLCLLTVYPSNTICQDPC